MDGREVVWLSLAILTLLVLVEIAYNLVIYVPNTNYPSPPPATIKTTSSTNTVIFNPVPYYSLLPTIINSSSLTVCDPEHVLISIPNGTPILLNIIRILSMNASEVTPSAYWKVADLGGFYVNQQFGKNVTYYIAPLPFNANGSQPKFGLAKLILDYYAFFPYIVTYPPSDYIVVSSPICKIINTYSVKTSVNVIYTTYTYLDYSDSYSYQEGNTTYCYVNNFYAMHVYGTAYLLANGNVISSQSFSHTFYWWGGEYGPNYIYGVVTVPPGVSKDVYGSYSIGAGAGYSFYQYCVGNTEYFVSNYYPTGPYVSTDSYQFNWYKYNVTLPIKVIVYNGSDPQTLINNKIYNCRNITAYVSYTTWSSLPYSYIAVIKTLDNIKYGNFTIIRRWNAGFVQIIPLPDTQISGNNIDHYLTFSALSKIAKQPEWVFNHTPEDEIYNENYANEYGELAYYYALYKFLYQLVQNNTIPYYYSYIKWEVDILANEIGLNMTVNNSSYDTVNPYFNALLNGGGNQSLVAMQPVLIDSWGMYYHVFNGTYYVQNESWEYSMVYGFTIPKIWLNSTPYIVLDGTNVTAYLTDPTNIEHSPIVFWWYNPSNLMYNDLPADGENVTFYTWYMLNPNLPIFFEKEEQNVTIEYYNSTIYEITQQP
jgi:hypothetical protein